MGTILKHGTAVLGRMIFIGFSVQIVLGLLWMYNAFSGFVKPGEGIVCVCAILLLEAALWFLVGALLPDCCRWQKVFVTLCVVTFPFVAQSLMYPDVRIFFTALLLLLAGAVLRRLGRREGQSVLKILCILVVFQIGAVGLTVGTDVSLNGWTSVCVRLTERTAWTTLYKCYNRLPEAVGEKIDYSTLVNSSVEAVGIRNILAPYLMEKYGTEEGEAVLTAFRETAWTYEKKQIIKEIVWDTAGYILSPVIVPLQLEGRAYESYTGRNYAELLQPAPQLGKFYTRYSCRWFTVAMAAALVVYGAGLFGGKKKPKLLLWGGTIYTGASMAVWYIADGAGRMDYKNTLFVLCLWLIWLAGGVRDEQKG